MSTETQHDTSPEQVEMRKLVAAMMSLMTATLKIQGEHKRMRGEIRRAEFAKMRSETRWHPIVVAAGAFAAGAVVF